MASASAFYFDLGSPEAYLAAERVNSALPAVPEWVPIHLGMTWEPSADVERRASEYRLQPVRWPEPWPQSSEMAMRAATFAKDTGRTVAFALAAFRQAFAAGRDLSAIDNVLIAAAACELHPNAVVKGVESRGVRERLAAATKEAVDRGVRDVPAIAVGDELFEDLDDAARAAR